MVELQFESAAGPSLERSAGPGAGALEPVVAAHPSDPAILALAYARARPATEASYGIVAAVRVSRDGGRTWRETKRHPWDRAGRGPSLHSAVAFGPGPSGEGRLYWAGTTSGGGDGVRIAIAWTDDLGSSWSRLHVVRDTPAWGGGFPDIAVDCDPDSPGYGNVYVVYAYPAAKGRGAGIHLLASGDHGRSWRGVDIARATADPASKASWRFGSRVRAAPDGAVYVSTYQADLRRWDAGDPFDRGGAANVTRVGFAVTRLTFDRTTRRFSAGPTTMAATLARNGYTVSRQVAPGTRAHTYLDPIWSHGLDVDPVTGRVFLAIGTVSARPATGQTRGSVAVGSSDDGGRHWTWQTLAQAPAVDGLRQSSFRPTLAVSGSLVFVGLHTIDEVALKGAWAADATIGTAYAVSPDGGRTFTTPAPVTPARWRASALERTYNGPGLRDRATSTADGRVAYAYGDARTAPSKTARATGQRQVYVALLSLGAPATPLPWQTRRAS